jgi:protein-S-isoprenylcysteine O-methyltransferase Ste14
MKLKVLVGSGDKIMLLTLPFLAAGVILNILFPAWFSVGGPSHILRVISLIVLIPGAVLWLWSVALVLIIVPQNRLITHGPYALVKHPLYTSVALLVLPWIGFLFNSWLGVLVGLVLYLASRIYSPAEEVALAKSFGSDWEEHQKKILLPWL